MASSEIRANVEQPRVCWLSSPEFAKLESSTTLQDQIRDIVEHLYICKNVDDCEYFIRGKHGHPQYEQIFLIATIDYLPLILKRDIHDVRVLETILILTENQCESSSMLKQYPKIAGIYSNAKDLLIQLSQSVDDFSKDSGVLISILKGCDVEMTTNIINNFADFSEFWFPLFIDLLFDLPIPSETTRTHDIKQFANECQRFYAHNRKTLVDIDEFLSSPNQYSSNVPIRYYTRDCFLFKRINKALRHQNFQAIFGFRFFLLDMQAQLQVAYSEFSHLYLIGDTMKFYRGQRISRKELDSLKEKRRIGSLITVNSYLSASITRNIAMTYIHGSPSGELIPVIFEISAEFKDPNVPRRKPFAYIGHLSHYHAAELEVLFSIGSFFRVEEITLDEEKNINIIKLTFIYDEDHHTITDDYGTLRACSLEEKLIKTGDLLSNHVKYGASEADTFYQRFLEGDYSPLIKAACHVGLGWLAFKLTKFDLAITCQEKALQMYKTLNDEHCSNYLYVISYNCIGAVYKQQKEYSKALSYYLKAYKIDSTVISIDKYAFYNSFNNIAAVNIAYIYKIQGYIEQAWSTYKDMLASAMNKSTLFHGATYLKIAEADFSEGTQCKNNNEQMEYIDNWKRFLDLSLTDMSSSYRRSIVSGALSIGLRFAHNEQTWNQAIDYYKKIIQVSSKFVNVSSDDYHIVIRCYQQIAELYRKKHSFAISISYAADGLNKLCKVSDLESITSFYESMIKTYEHKLQQMNSNSSPDDIDSKISLDRTKFATIVLNFERNEFSFGQYAKKLNGNLLKEPNLKRCLAYCRLKTAALKHDQGKTKGIRELLYETSTLLPDDEQIQLICNNNLAYLDNKFYQIIDNYKKSLEKRLNENQTSCIGEDAFCYIAHLYGQMDDINAAQQWYIKAITYFMDHKFVCEHTQSCFVKMASFYQTKNDLPSCVSTYLQLVHHLLNYRDGTFQLQREIVVIVEYLLKQLDTDNKEQICILERLKQLVLRQFKDIDFLDADFQWIIDRYTKNKKHSWIAAHAYESYLDHIFQYINRPLTPYVQMITPNFRRAITFYKLSDDPAGAFDVYQRLVDIVLKHPEDRNHIISTFKRIGLDLEEKRQTKAVLDIYEALRQFIFEHPAQIVFQDNDLIIYILVRHQMLIERDKEPAAPIYRKMIHILRSHKEQFNPDFKLQLYLELLEKYYMGLGLVEPLSALDSYYNLLDIFLNLRSENFDNLLTKIVNAMKDRPVELLELLTKYQFNYIQLIRQVYRRLSHPNDRSIMCRPFPSTRSDYINDIMSSFAKKAKRCLAANKGEKTIIQCWTKCIYFLLENCSKNDEYFASCYIQLSDTLRAADVFDPIVYCNLALQYCPNASRRYLKYVYPQTQIQEKLELRFADHFYLVNGKKEIRPLESVNY